MHMGCDMGKIYYSSSYVACSYWHSARSFTGNAFYGLQALHILMAWYEYKSGMFAPITLLTFLVLGEKVNIYDICETRIRSGQGTSTNYRQSLGS